MLDPRERRWARLLEALPDHLGPVTRWQAGPEPRGEGHLHHVPTLAVCLAGVLRISRPGTRLDLAPGAALLLAPGVWHQHAPLRRGAIAFNLGFLPAACDLAFGDDQGWRTGCVPLHPARRICARALSEPDPRTAVRDLLVAVLAEDIRPVGLFVHPAMGRMLGTFWRRLHLGVGAADLVRASGLGPSRAFAIFKEAYGLTPHQALGRARLELAAGLLAAGVGVGETARRCGYPDRRAFTRAWRTVHGTPPLRHLVAGDPFPS
jgi:AraC-like DNA-binding protein